jgi:hypothetical protein
MSDFWFDCDPEKGSDDVPGMVFAHVRGLDAQMSLLHALFAENASRYAGKGVFGVGGPKAIGKFTSQGQDYSVTENIVASVVDTAVSLIAANRPRPTFMTDGAEWSKQQHAKKLSKFTLGLYDQLKVYETWVRGFKDAGIQGIGAVKIIAANDKPCVERTHIDRIIVDEQEAMDCEPRQLHQRRYVDKAILKRCYPECAATIDKANTATGQLGSQTRTSNLVEVMESWRLPTEEGADDGRYAVCIEGECLDFARYAKDYFPFVFFHWNQPETGWYGQGIVEPLTGLQIRLNQLNRFIKKCQDTIARPDIYGAFDQRLPDAFFENGVGRFFRTKDGKAPTFYTPQALNAETYNERRYIVERAFALAGVGEMTAQGKKQPGVESGIAIREVNDIQAGRFGIQAEHFEDVHIQTAQRLTWVMKDISEAGRKKVTVAFKAKKFTETINWSEVDPKEDVYRVDVEASSLLSRTPAGRKQDAMDLLQMGAIDKSEFLYLLDDPDLQRIQDFKNVARSYAEYAIEKTNEGIYVAPEPFEDLTLAIKLGQLARQKAKLDGAPEEILELHMRRIAAAQSLLEQASAPDPMAPPAPMAPGMPMDPAMMGGAPMMDPMTGMPGAPPQGMVPGAPLPGPGQPLPPGM